MKIPKGEQNDASSVIDPPKPVARSYFYRIAPVDGQLLVPWVTPAMHSFEETPSSFGLFHHLYGLIVKMYIS